MKKVSLFFIKRILCDLLLYVAIGGGILSLYFYGVDHDLISKQYETLLFLIVMSIAIVPFADDLFVWLFKNYTLNEYIILETNTIKIFSNTIMKNAGSQEKKIMNKGIKQVDFKYQHFPCLEHIMISFEDTVIKIHKKDFRSKDYLEIKII